MRTDRRTFLQMALPAAAIIAAGSSPAAAALETKPKPEASDRGLWWFKIDAEPPAADGGRFHQLCGVERAVDTNAAKACFACTNAEPFFGFHPGELLLVSIDLTPFVSRDSLEKLWHVKFTFLQRPASQLASYGRAHFKRLAGTDRGIGLSAGRQIGEHARGRGVDQGKLKD